MGLGGEPGSRLHYAGRERDREPDRRDRPPLERPMYGRSPSFGSFGPVGPGMDRLAPSKRPRKPLDAPGEEIPGPSPRGYGGERFVARDHRERGMYGGQMDGPIDLPHAERHGGFYGEGGRFGMGPRVSGGGMEGGPNMYGHDMDMARGGKYYGPNVYGGEFNRGRDADDRWGGPGKEGWDRDRDLPGMIPPRGRGPPEVFNRDVGPRRVGSSEQLAAREGERGLAPRREGPERDGRELDRRDRQGSSSSVGGRETERRGPVADDRDGATSAGPAGLMSPPSGSGTLARWGSTGAIPSSILPSSSSVSASAAAAPTQPKASTASLGGAGSAGGGGGSSSGDAPGREAGIGSLSGAKPAAVAAAGAAAAAAATSAPGTLGRSFSDGKLLGQYGASPEPKERFGGASGGGGISASGVVASASDASLSSKDPATASLPTSVTGLNPASGAHASGIHASASDSLLSDAPKFLFDLGTPGGAKASAGAGGGGGSRLGDAAGGGGNVGTVGASASDCGAPASTPAKRPRLGWGQGLAAFERKTPAKRGAEGSGATNNEEEGESNRGGAEASLSTGTSGQGGVLGGGGGLFGTATGGGGGASASTATSLSSGPDRDEPPASMARLGGVLGMSSLAHLGASVTAAAASWSLASAGGSGTFSLSVVAGDKAGGLGGLERVPSPAGGLSTVGSGGAGASITGMAGDALTAAALSGGQPGGSGAAAAGAEEGSLVRTSSLPSHASDAMLASAGPGGLPGGMGSSAVAGGSITGSGTGAGAAGLSSSSAGVPTASLTTGSGVLPAYGAAGGGVGSSSGSGATSGALPATARPLSAASFLASLSTPIGGAVAAASGLLGGDKGAAAGGNTPGLSSGGLAGIGGGAAGTGAGASAGVSVLDSVLGRAGGVLPLRGVTGISGITGIGSAGSGGLSAGQLAAAKAVADAVQSSLFAATVTTAAATAGPLGTVGVTPASPGGLPLPLPLPLASAQGIGAGGSSGWPSWPLPSPLGGTLGSSFGASSASASAAGTAGVAAGGSVEATLPTGTASSSGPGLLPSSAPGLYGWQSSSVMPSFDLTGRQLSSGALSSGDASAGAADRSALSGAMTAPSSSLSSSGARLGPTKGDAAVNGSIRAEPAALSQPAGGNSVGTPSGLAVKMEGVTDGKLIAGVAPGVTGLPPPWADTGRAVGTVVGVSAPIPAPVGPVPAAALGLPGAAGVEGGQGRAGAGVGVGAGACAAPAVTKDEILRRMEQVDRDIEELEERLAHRQGGGGSMPAGGAAAVENGAGGGAGSAVAGIGVDAGGSPTGQDAGPARLEEGVAADGAKSPTRPADASVGEVGASAVDLVTREAGGEDKSSAQVEGEDGAPLTSAGDAARSEGALADASTREAEGEEVVEVSRGKGAPLGEGGAGAEGQGGSEGGTTAAAPVASVANASAVAEDKARAADVKQEEGQGGAGDVAMADAVGPGMPSPARGAPGSGRDVSGGSGDVDMVPSDDVGAGDAHVPPPLVADGGRKEDLVVDADSVPATVSGAKDADSAVPRAGDEGGQGAAAPVKTEAEEVPCASALVPSLAPCAQPPRPSIDAAGSSEAMEEMPGMFGHDASASVGDRPPLTGKGDGDALGLASVLGRSEDTGAGDEGNEGETKEGEAKGEGKATAKLEGDVVASASADIAVAPASASVEGEPVPVDDMVGDGVAPQVLLAVADGRVEVATATTAKEESKEDSPEGAVGQPLALLPATPSEPVPPSPPAAPALSLLTPQQVIAGILLSNMARAAAAEAMFDHLLPSPPPLAVIPPRGTPADKLSLKDGQEAKEGEAGKGTDGTETGGAKGSRDGDAGVKEPTDNEGTAQYPLKGNSASRPQGNGGALTSHKRPLLDAATQRSLGRPLALLMALTSAQPVATVLPPCLLAPVTSSSLLPPQLLQSLRRRAAVFYSPSELPSYHANRATHDRLAPTILRVIKARREQVVEKELTLALQYRQLRETYKARMAERGGAGAAAGGSAGRGAPGGRGVGGSSSRRGGSRMPVMPGPPLGRSSSRLSRVFSGSVRSDYEEAQVLNYLQEAERLKTLVRIPPMILDEREKAARAFPSRNGLVEDPVADYEAAKLVRPWSEAERRIFVDKFLIYNKNFRKIARHLEGRTTQDCVRFYYLHQKGEDFDCLRQRQHPAKKKDVLTHGGRGAGGGGSRAGATPTSRGTANIPPLERGLSESDLQAGGNKGGGYNTGSRTPAPAATPAPPAFTPATFPVTKARRTPVTKASIPVGWRASGAGAETPNGGAATPATPGPRPRPGPSGRPGPGAEGAPGPGPNGFVQDGGGLEEREDPPWGEDEHRRFVAALVEVGRNFRALSNAVGTRTAFECKAYFGRGRKRLGFDKLVEQHAAAVAAAVATGSGAPGATGGREKRVVTHWTAAEKEMFMAQYRRHGRDWKVLQEAIPGKSLNQIKNYFQNYKAKLGLTNLQALAAAGPGAGGSIIPPAATPAAAGGAAAAGATGEGDTGAGAARAGVPAPTRTRKRKNHDMPAGETGVGAPTGKRGGATVAAPADLLAPPHSSMGPPSPSHRASYSARDKDMSGMPGGGSAAAAKPPRASSPALHYDGLPQPPGPGAPAPAFHRPLYHTSPHLPASDDERDPRGMEHPGVGGDPHTGTAGAAGMPGMGGMPPPYMGMMYPGSGSPHLAPGEVVGAGDRAGGTGGAGPGGHTAAYMDSMFALTHPGLTRHGMAHHGMYHGMPMSSSLSAAAGGMPLGHGRHVMGSQELRGGPQGLAGVMEARGGGSEQDPHIPPQMSVHSLTAQLAMAAAAAAAPGGGGVMGHGAHPAVLGRGYYDDPRWLGHPHAHAHAAAAAAAHSHAAAGQQAAAEAHYRAAAAAAAAAAGGRQHYAHMLQQYYGGALMSPQQLLEMQQQQQQQQQAPLPQQDSPRSPTVHQHPSQHMHPHHAPPQAHGYGSQHIGPHGSGAGGGAAQPSAQPGGASTVKLFGRSLWLPSALANASSHGGQAASHGPPGMGMGAGGPLEAHAHGMVDRWGGYRQGGDAPLMRPRGEHGHVRAMPGHGRGAPEDEEEEEEDEEEAGREGGRGGGRRQGEEWGDAAGAAPRGGRGRKRSRAWERSGEEDGEYEGNGGGRPMPMPRYDAGRAGERGRGEEEADEEAAWAAEEREAAEKAAAAREVEEAARAHGRRGGEERAWGWGAARSGALIADIEHRKPHGHGHEREREDAARAREREREWQREAEEQREWQRPQRQPATEEEESPHRHRLPSSPGRRRHAEHPFMDPPHKHYPPAQEGPRAVPARPASSGNEEGEEEEEDSADWRREGPGTAAAHAAHRGGAWQGGEGWDGRPAGVASPRPRYAGRGAEEEGAWRYGRQQYEEGAGRTAGWDRDGRPRHEARGREEGDGDERERAEARGGHREERAPAGTGGSGAVGKGYSRPRHARSEEEEEEEEADRGAPASQEEHGEAEWARQGRLESRGEGRARGGDNEGKDYLDAEEGEGEEMEEEEREDEEEGEEEGAVGRGWRGRPGGREVDVGEERGEEVGGGEDHGRARFRGNRPDAEGENMREDGRYQGEGED
eukprot:jgi/Mesvir1/11264/Mv01065-RA.3